jgi:hypothetical protein
MYIDTWHRFKCDGCSAENWVCEGDINDLTTIDYDGFACWKCDKYNITLQTDYEEPTENPLYSRGKHYIQVDERE